MTQPNIIIGITQRVVVVAQRNERRDVLDQAWTRFLADCGMQPLPVPNALPDPVEYLRQHGARGVVLTGGGNISSAMGTLDGAPAHTPPDVADIAPERDAMETALLRGSVEFGWPVLGVCRGMQALNLFHGGRIAPLTGHAGVRHSLSVAEHSGWSGPGFDSHVNSFHDFGIPPDGLGSELDVLADAEGWPEAFVHRAYPHLGIMWHPERESPFSENDQLLFRYFFETSQRRS
jgi:putative glutamine amidotransferase